MVARYRKVTSSMVQIPRHFCLLPVLTAAILLSCAGQEPGEDSQLGHNLVFGSPRAQWVQRLPESRPSRPPEVIVTTACFQPEVLSESLLGASSLAGMIALLVVQRRRFQRRRGRSHHGVRAVWPWKIWLAIGACAAMAGAWSSSAGSGIIRRAVVPEIGSSAGIPWVLEQGDDDSFMLRLFYDGLWWSRALPARSMAVARPTTGTSSEITCSGKGSGIRELHCSRCSFSSPTPGAGRIALLNANQNAPEAISFGQLLMDLGAVETVSIGNMQDLLLKRIPAPGLLTLLFTEHPEEISLQELTSFQEPAHGQYLLEERVDPDSDYLLACIVPVSDWSSMSARVSASPGRRLDELWPGLSCLGDLPRTVFASDECLDCIACRAGPCRSLFVSEPPYTALAGEAPMQFQALGCSSFQMGSPPGEPGREMDEGPVHTVRLSPFMVSITEVTQAQWEAVMGGNPSAMRSPNRPVEMVSWCDALRFANRLSLLEGLQTAYEMDESCEGHGSVAWDRGADGFRLLTEAEWEMATRAGTRGPYWSGNDSQALQRAGFCHLGLEQQASLGSVASLSPNPLGLFDVHGGVYEWVWDYYTDTYESEALDDPTGPSQGRYRVLRGGSWRDGIRDCRSAARNAAHPAYSDNTIGLRIARNWYGVREPSGHPGTGGSSTWSPIPRKDDSTVQSPQQGQDGALGGLL